MATSLKVQTLRSLIRELRIGMGHNQKLQNTPIFSYLMSEYRRNALTDMQHCHEQETMAYLAQTCATYLESTRRYQEIQDEYKGSGERSVSETAGLVGFKLPNER